LTSEMEQEIDWEKMFRISELITLGLVAIIGTAVVLNAVLPDPITLPSGSIFAYLFLFCGFAMPISGIVNFLISRRAQATKFHIRLCFIEALLIIIFFFSLFQVVYY